MAELQEPAVCWPNAGLGARDHKEGSGHPKHDWVWCGMCRTYTCAYCVRYHYEVPNEERPPDVRWPRISA